MSPWNSQYFHPGLQRAPHFKAKSLEVGWYSYLMISLSRGVGEAKDPSHTRSRFKSKLPRSPGGKRPIRHPIPPPEFLFPWLWAGVCEQRRLPFCWVATWCFRRKRKLQSSHSDTVGLRWPLPAEIYLTVFSCTPYHPCIFSDLPWALLQMGVLLYTQGPNTADMQNPCSSILCLHITQYWNSIWGRGWGDRSHIRFGVWSSPTFKCLIFPWSCFMFSLQAHLFIYISSYTHYPGR